MCKWHFVIGLIARLFATRKKDVMLELYLFTCSDVQLDYMANMAGILKKVEIA